MNWATCFLLVGFASGCGDPTTTTSTKGIANPLTAQCVEEREYAPTEAWICGEDQTVECNSPSGVELDAIYVVTGHHGALDCSLGYAVDNPGPFTLGEHEVNVTATYADGSTTSACSSTLSVVDTTAPRVRTKPVYLWPPNHKMHRVTTSDCLEVEDACDSTLSVSFTYATSDEPVDSLGDGHHLPDIGNVACDGVDLRAERQGGRNGRVYTLGWRVVDNAGNASEGVCKVKVQHDQSGREAVDSGEAYRVEIEDSSACEHNEEPEMPPAAPTPPSDEPQADDMDPRGDI
jgi:hypothetical protein